MSPTRPQGGSLEVEAAAVDGLEVRGGILALPAQTQEGPDHRTQRLIEGQAQRRPGFPVLPAGVQIGLGGPRDHDPVVALSQSRVDAVVSLSDVEVVVVAVVVLSNVHADPAEGPVPVLPHQNTAPVVGRQEGVTGVDEDLIHKLRELVVGVGVLVDIEGGIGDAAGDLHAAVRVALESVRVPDLQQMAAVAPVDVLYVVLQVGRPRGEDHGRDRVQAIARSEAEVEGDLVLLDGVVDQLGLDWGDPATGVVRAACGRGLLALEGSGDEQVEFQLVIDVVGQGLAREERSQRQRGRQAWDDRR